MIEQILAHLIGDYLLQTDKMATMKTKSMYWAAIHAAFYTLPFLLLTRNPLALVIIFGTHVLIDRYRLAKYVIQFKNALGDWKNRAQFNTSTGYADTVPVWMSVWLFIISDNTCHLFINYFALKLQ